MIYRDLVGRVMYIPGAECGAHCCHVVCGDPDCDVEVELPYRGLSNVKRTLRSRGWLVSSSADTLCDSRIDFYCPACRSFYERRGRPSTKA